MGTKLEKKDHKECISCLGFQEMITKVNLQCTLLELDIGKKNSVIERLEDEVKLLKQKNEDLEKSIRNGKEKEEDTVLQLRIENKTLECEKKIENDKDEDIPCYYSRKRKMTGDYEADLLANLAKCSELCMKAVCALYRQQTSEEKSCKATIVRNGQGFNQIHALMGSNLAEFLTDGDPQSDVKKSVEELLEFDPKGVENCKKLAIYYSKQLFEIYYNGTDPFFRP